MDSLEKENGHYHDKYVKFMEGTHRIMVKGQGGYTSVTRFHGRNFKPFDSDKVIENMMKSKNWPNSKYFGMEVEEIKDLWKKNGEESAEAGTKMHYDIECFYNNVDNKNTSPEFEYFKKFHEKHSNLQPYRTEWMVYDETLKIAGIIDMVFKLPNGTFAIYDWKRCKSIEKTKSFLEYSTNPIIEHIPDTNYWHYALQLNTYCQILVRNYDIIVSEMYLVALHPENNKYEKHKVPFLNEEMEALFNERSDELAKREK